MDVGAVVDDFELPDETGTPRRLRTVGERARGAVLLPGGDDHGLHQGELPLPRPRREFSAAGAQRVGISRDPVAKQLQFSEKHEFDYPLLSDADGEVARMMGVARKRGRRSGSRS